LINIDVKPNFTAMKNIVISTWFVLFFLFISNAQQADFGDAPDGGSFNGIPLNYPSLKASNGPMHTAAVNTTFWIAKNKFLSRPDVENDSRQVNQDIDNGQPFLFVFLLGIPAPAKVTVPVTTAPNHDPLKILYLNVAIDVDDDYDYTDKPDRNWIVRNRPFNIPADTTIGIVSDWFGFGSNLLLFPVWLRATVTDAPVSQDWNTGNSVNSYGNGETEDWFYTFGRADNYPPEWSDPPRDSLDKDSLPNKKPKNPKPVKCVKAYYPKVVYVKCGKDKCFWMKVVNCGSDTVKDVSVGFTFDKGKPLPGGGPKVNKVNGKPPVAGPPYDLDEHGDVLWFKICFTGWPCTSDPETRWARYKVNLKYDPDGLYMEELGELTVGNPEFPFIDASFQGKLAVEPVIDTVDSPIWDAVEGKPFMKSLMVYTGRINGVQRWINGKPILTVKNLPPWASLVEVNATPDTTFYDIMGIPGPDAISIVDIVFTAQSDLPGDTMMVQPADWVFQMHIDHVNNAPVLDTTFPPVLNMAVNQAIKQRIVASDKDLQSQKRDTLFVDYNILDKNTDTVVKFANPPVFTDNGDGTAMFDWTPTISEIGNYKLEAVVWDYHFAKDASITVLTIAVGIDDIGLQVFEALIYPNPTSGVATLELSLQNRQALKGVLYAVNGEQVQYVFDKEWEPGKHTVQLYLQDLPQGVYYLKIYNEHESVMRKLIILKP
jgi:Secretion system C-terminal sorting domain